MATVVEDAVKDFIKAHKYQINQRDWNVIYDDAYSFNNRFNLADTLTVILLKHGIDLIKEVSMNATVINEKIISSFIRATSADTFVMPANIEVVHSNSFSFCPSLRKIDLGQCEATVLVTNTVHDCGKLEEIILPPNLEMILADAVKGPNDILEINIPDNCKVIKSRAFSDCNRVKKVHLPANLQKFNTSSVVGHAFTPKKLVYEYAGPDLDIRMKVAADNLRRTQL